MGKRTGEGVSRYPILYDNGQPGCFDVCSAKMDSQRTGTAKMMIYAVALNRYMLLVFTAGILIGTLGIFTEQIVFLTQHYSAEFITEEIKLEDDIALLMALYGVFLDKRRWVVHFQVADDASDATKAFADDTQKTGIALILIAIIVKVIDMFFMSMNTWGLGSTSFVYLEVVFLFAVNVVAMLLLVRFLFSLMKSWAVVGPA